MVIDHKHPRADSRGRVPEHILVVEKATGIVIKYPIVIHHLDYCHLNNKNNNLVVCPNRLYHSLLHRRTNAIKAVGNPGARKCRFCGGWDVPEKGYMTERKLGVNDHVYCKRIYQSTRRKNGN
jgi:hypothetical protein